MKNVKKQTAAVAPIFLLITGLQALDYVSTLFNGRSVLFRILEGVSIFLFSQVFMFVMINTLRIEQMIPKLNFFRMRLNVNFKDECLSENDRERVKSEFNLIYSFARIVQHTNMLLWGAAMVMMYLWTAVLIFFGFIFLPFCFYTNNAGAIFVVGISNDIDRVFVRTIDYWFYLSMVRYHESTLIIGKMREFAKINMPKGA